MGDVYLAHDPTLGRDIALKLLRSESTQGGLAEEARALAAMRHPGIVTIFEIGQHEGQDFIAMEYIAGRTLRQCLASGATREELVAICAQVTVALAAAHRAGVLHRDIKPENVIVGDGGEVKVVDFGLAHRVAADDRSPSNSDVIDQLRRTLPPDVRRTLEMSAVGPADSQLDIQTVYGTPAYMAPEALLGVPANEASDVYSLGVVLYECLAGRRPHDAQSVIEAIAWFVDGPPARLDDPLGALVEAMLAHDASQRPRLDEVAAALATPQTAPVVVSIVEALAPPRKRRWPLALALALVLAASVVGVVAWRLAPAGDGADAGSSITIAITPLSMRIPSYGREQAPLQPAVDTLARLFGEIEGGKLAGTTVGTRGEARALGAAYVAVVTIEEQGTMVVAEAELVRLADEHPVVHVSVKRPVEQLAALFEQVAVELARAVSPKARLATPNRRRAEAFFRSGDALLRDGRFTEARFYLEQAVGADPTFADAWYGVAITRAWMEAPESLVLAAADRARGGAQGVKAALADGIAAFLHMRFGESRRLLVPLEGKVDFDRAMWLYYLGEANWHDGRHEAGFERFAQALVADPRFTPASIHAWQYAVARRDAQRATYYLGIAKTSAEWIEFATRHYAELGGGHSPLSVWAQIVLGGRSPALDDMRTRDSLEGAAYRISDAIDRGDTTAAERELATAWPRWIAKARDGLASVLYELEGIGEQVIAAGMRDEARRIVTFLAEQSREHPARGYHRLAILAAPLLGDPALLRHPELSERNTKLAEASAAELAGDRAKAASILGELVADPTFSWDYPERAALLRNLRALGRTAEADALCSETLEPAVFRLAYTALRRACRDHR